MNPEIPAFNPPSPYTLVGPPTPSRFFALRDLQSFAATAIEPYATSGDAHIVLDFSHVKVWDVAALLWLVMALHHYRRQGMSFLLRLPQGRRNEMQPQEADEFDRSADYLRRWRFDRALLNLTPDPDSLLLPEQRGYFAGGEPRRFYADRAELGDQGILESLISRRLVQIRSLSDPTLLGRSSISDQRIVNCISAFQSARMGDVLYAQCGIPKREADLFAEHILTEALLNVREHPNATIGLIALSIMGNANELILSVADNGDPISKTIYPIYRRNYPQQLSPDYDRTKLDCGQRAKIIHFATEEGVTSKAGLAALHPNAGMGLTYIKRDTASTFHGKLRIISDGVSVKYTAGRLSDPESEPWSHSWPGNLLRVAIPLSRPEAQESSGGGR